ncbi:phage major capsid protein, P2 family [Pseudoalteromonas sp. S979]|uniref:phage major capsid protein, P2 family n=1 Tax=Pseudoalteromonas TaxID=53246 RepID=UPI0002C9E9E0|nr:MULTISPECIES: phage major capsid protein, P2 family [Pseudoalteromonas]ENN97618.1 P2 family phage major capsid protein [Pseudoalteromonas agarivorans S816]TMS95439.1 phage major capsid protein, P2 family [Pseudoalteromonas sp. S979]
MKTKTKQLFVAVLAGMASNYGVASMSEQFNVEPTTEQRLYDATYESAEFLQMINTALVDDIVGQSVIMSVDGGVTGRAGVETDDTKERKTRDVSKLAKREYRCYPVECDIHITWNKMDQWSKFPDFHQRYRNHVRQAIALDIIKIGFNGTSAADTTDITTNTMLQDVNIGWLQLLRRDAPERVITEGAVTDEIRIGAGGDYENLDQAVHDALQGIPVHKRVNMVAIIGDELLANDKNKLYAKQAHTPSEKTKIELQQVIDTYGGLASYKIPFFPERGILITSFENLSHYVQAGSTRTHVEDNAKKKRVEDYLSRNDCYYVEDLEKAMYFESANIKLPNSAGDAWV